MFMILCPPFYIPGWEKIFSSRLEFIMKSVIDSVSFKVLKDVNFKELVVSTETFKSLL